MRIWVDADGCSARVRETVRRASERVGIPAEFVAAVPISIRRSTRIGVVRVPAGRDAADRHILERAEGGDLAVTADVPLAGELVGMGVMVIHPRGDLFTEGNIGPRLSERNAMARLRAMGVSTRTGSRRAQDRHKRFADLLDSVLRKLAGPV